MNVVTDHEPRFPPNLHKSWIPWASFVVVILPLIRLGFFYRMPCKRPPYYRPIPYYDPVNYSELITEHTLKNCDIIWPWALIIPVVCILLLIFSTGRRFITIPATIFANSVTFSLLSITFGLFLVDGTTLIEHDSIEFNGHHYHLAEAEVLAGEGDVSFVTLFLHECDLDDTNCYGRDLNVDGYPFENPSFVVNQETDQLEVWVELWGDNKTEVVFTLSTNDDFWPQLAP